jgi:ligand-binding sensor domain-containing protein/signal transduction histidine kinase
MHCFEKNARVNIWAMQPTVKRLRTLAGWLLLAVLVCTACARQCSAQGLDSYTRRVWQATDGLPEQTVQAFAQTPDGFLWVGTTGGLLRFDGAHFTLFDRQNTPSLHENNIFCLMVSRDGALWIGTEGGGLARYAQGQFRSWTARDSSARDGISNDFVRALAQDGDGVIWAGTDNGLLRLDGEHFVRVDAVSGIPALAVHGIFPDRDGSLWVGGSRLMRFQGGQAREYALLGEASQNRVKSILRTRDGTLWVGTVSGLNRMPPGKDAFERVSGISATVRVLRQASDGLLWIGTIGQGAFTFRDGRLTQISAPDQLPSNTVLNFFEDDEMNFWVGTQAGMLRLARTPLVVTPLPQANDSDFGTVYQDRDGSFWIGSTRLFRMRNGVVQPEVLPGLEGVHVRNVLRDRAGALWVGTDGDGVYRLPASPPAHYTSKDGMSNNFVRAMTQDQDGSMWIATDEGINHIFPGAGTSRIRSFQMHDGLVYFSTRALLEDRRGDLWIGTDSGLSHLHRGAFVTDAATEALAQLKIWTIHEDADGGLWFGTRNSGLFRFRDGKMAHFTTQDGLATNAIYQILEDASGRFWMSGPNGISLLNRHELDAQADSPSRHLALMFYSVAEISGVVDIYGGTQSSGCITAQGDVWFPSSRGPIHVLPTQRAELPPPPVRIENILADGSPISLAGPMRLPPGTGRLEFTYAPIRLRSQDGVRFRYRLDDFDHDWTAPTASRSAEYTNLPPGNYRFRVQAFEIDNPNAVSEVAVDLVQEPRFYRTWWFLTGCVLLLALIIYILYRSRVRQVRARFEAVLEERSRLAREMHDTVIQGCTSVSALLEALSMDEADEVPRDGLMDFARSQLSTTINEARDAIWNLRQPDGSADGLGQKIQSMGRQIGAEFNTPIEYSITGTPFAASQPVSHDLLMVAREAVLNAVRHGSPARVEVHLAYSRRELAMNVIDDGCGFDPNQAEHLNGHHFGLKGMKERIQRCGGKLRIVSAAGKGVRIDVRLPRPR